MTEVVREAAGAIAPAMHALAPIISQLAATFGGVLLQAVQTVVGMIQGLLPLFALGEMFKLLMMALNPTVLGFMLLAAVLAPFSDIINTATALLGDAFNALQIVLRAVGETIGQLVMSLFGGDHKTVMDAMTEAIHWVVKELILMSVWLADLMGVGKKYRDSLAAELHKASEPQKDAADKAAPLNVHVSSLEQISRDLAIAAALAGQTTGSAMTDNAYLGKIADIVEKLAPGDLEAKLKEDMESALKTALDALWSKVTEWFPHLPTRPVPLPGGFPDRGGFNAGFGGLGGGPGA
jgi:hypothetical protein